MNKITLENLSFDASNISIDENKGFLRCDNCTFGRVGVLDYVRNGKIFKVLIRPETMEQALDSLIDLDITNDHPKGSEMLNAKNFRKLTVGNVSGKPIFENGTLKGSLVVKDAAAIQDIASGKIELSLGYLHDRLEVGGTWIDEFGVMGEIGKAYSYDAETINIVYNHISIVDKGRAGIAKISFDSADDFTDYTLNVQQANTKNSKNMVAILIGSRTVEISNDDASHVEAFLASQKSDIETKQSTIETLEAEKASKDAKISGLEGEKLGLEASLTEAKAAKDAAEAKTVSMDADVISGEVKSRMAAWALVSGTVSFDASLSEAEIKKAYVAAKLPTLSLDGKDDSFIDGVFSTLPKTSKTIKELRSQDSMEVKTNGETGAEALDEMTELGMNNNGEQVSLDQMVAAKMKKGRDAIVKDAKKNRVSFSLNALNAANKK